MKRFPPFGKSLGNADQECFLATKGIEAVTVRKKVYRRGPESWGKRSLQVLCVSVPGILTLTSSEGEQVQSGGGVWFRGTTWIQESVLELGDTGVGELFPIGAFPARLKDLFGGVLSERQILQVVKGDDVRLFVCWE